ncbi:hypothetical protein MESS4_750303 [Mesorhizobium sp. STM 4661]|nr:hypothetical protein MESS4_750303 [Mesorhizobium sp. STM 4661]
MPTDFDVPPDPPVTEVLYQPVDDELVIRKRRASLVDAFENVLAIGGHDAASCRTSHKLRDAKN